MIEEASIHKHTKKGVWVLVISALFVVALFIALDQLQLTDIKRSLLSADPLLIALSTVSMCLAFVGMGFRWRALMPVKPPIFPLSGIICAGLLLNYATPGPLGELASAYFASKRYSLSFTEALASGVIARLVGLISAAILGAFIWILFPLSIQEDLVLPIELIALFCLGLGLGLLSVLFFPSFWKHITEPRSTENPRSSIKKYVLLAQKSIYQLCMDAISLSQSPKSSYPYAVLWSFFSHMSVIISIILMAFSLHADASISGIIFTYAITTAGAVLLFALPGSYIGWDALFLGLLLSTSGLTQTQSITIVGIVRIQQLGYMLLGAISLNWLIQPSISSPHKE